MDGESCSTTRRHSAAEPDSLNVNDEIVESLRCSCIDAHLQELIQVRSRYAGDRHRQQSRAAGVFEDDSTNCTHCLEDKLFGWYDLAIHAAERRNVWLALMYKSEGSVRTQVDLA